MTNEKPIDYVARAKQDIINAGESEAAYSKDFYIQRAQVHAILAVAEAIKELAKK